MDFRGRKIPRYKTVPLIRDCDYVFSTEGLAFAKLHEPSAPFVSDLLIPLFITQLTQLLRLAAFSIRSASAATSFKTAVNNSKVTWKSIFRLIELNRTTRGIAFAFNYKKLDSLNRSFLFCCAWN
jgi:hypothetical protein